MEEQEARRIQAKMRDIMQEDDFGTDDIQTGTGDKEQIL